MENVSEVISNINTNLSQKSASHKDEVMVMRAMLNDPNYSVDVYKNDGTTTPYCPGQDFKRVVTNVVSTVTHIPKKEAQELVDNYEFTKADAESMVNVSKEFVNSYLQTGRKLPLGGRYNSNIELLWKDIPEKETPIPNKQGMRSSVTIPAHGGIKVFQRCPKWVK